MFENIPFWNQWPKRERYWYISLLSLLLISLVIYFIAYSAGTGFSINWEVISTVKPQQVLFDEFFVGLNKIPIYVEQFVIQQHFEAGPLEIHPTLSIAFYALFLSSLLILYAYATTCSRFWFIVASALLIIIFITFRLENLLLLDQYNKTGLIIAMVCLLPLGYYLHAFRDNASMATRIALMLVAGAIMTGLVLYLSEAQMPAFQWAQYGILAPLFITIYFTLLIGHEVIAGALNVITYYNRSGDKNTLTHFLIFSILYLGNALLVYLYNRRIIEWELTLIDAFWLFAINTVAGIWGFRQREVNYQYIFRFKTTGAAVYLLLAFISTNTISFFFITANDAMLEVIEDAIVFSQLGYSLIFFFYILTNFIQLLYENQQVSKVMYKPSRMPYFTSRFAGTIAVAALFFVSQMLPYQQGISGYLSGIGDIYRITDNSAVAEHYYQQAVGLGQKSHRSNYALASLAQEDGNRKKEIRYLAQSIEKHPSPYAMANLSQRYLDRDQFFDGLFLLKNSVIIFPESGPLQNNLALAFGTTDITDSAFYFLENALAKRKSRDEARTNMVGLLAQKNYDFTTDTLAQLWLESDDKAYRSNLLTFANRAYVNVDTSAGYRFGNPDNVSPQDLVFNYNVLLNRPSLADSSFWQQMKAYYEASNTYWMEEPLHFAGAVASAKSGEVNQSVATLSSLVAQEGVREGVFAYTLGNIALQHRAPMLAAENYEKAVRKGLGKALPGWGFSLLEAGKTDEGLDIWRRIIQADTEGKAMGEKIIRLAGTSNISALTDISDEDKYVFLRYFSEDWPIDILEGLILTIMDDNIKAAAYVWLADWAYRNQDYEMVKVWLVKAEGCQFNADYVYEPYLRLLTLLYFQESDTKMLEELGKEIEENFPALGSYAQLATARIEEVAGDLNKAYQLYLELIERNAMIEEAVLSAVYHANFYNKDQEAAYEILIQALETNPYDVQINQAYILQAIRVGLRAYARDGMEDLRTFNKKAYDAFLPEYQEALELYNAENDWSN